MITLEDFLQTPEGRELSVEMADDLLYHGRIMIDTQERTKEAMIAFGAKAIYQHNNFGKLD